MAEIKALNPEIQELLEKIKKQAKLYEDAFEYFEAQRKEFEDIKFLLDVKEKDFTSYFEALKNSIEEFKNKTSDSINRTNQSFQEELNKIKDINNNVKQIRKFKEILEKDIKDINENFNTIKKQFYQLSSDLAGQIDISIKDIAKSTEEKLQKFKSDFDSELLNISQETKNKINDIENFAKLIKVEFDKKIDKLNYELSVLTKKIEKENEKYDTYLTKVRDEIHSVNENLTNRITDLKKEVFSSGNRNLSFENEADIKSKFLSKDEFKAELKSFEIEIINLINNLNGDIEDLDNKLNKVKLQFNMTLFVAISSLIGIVILFVIFFSNF